MKLFTHNILKCNSKKCTSSYPLKIVAKKVDTQQGNFNQETTERFLKKVDPVVLNQAVKDIDCKTTITDFTKLGENDAKNIEVLKEIHRILFEVVLVEGELVCNGCGLNYPVMNGIADMVVDE